jgi:hypothetical protein
MIIDSGYNWNGTCNLHNIIVNGLEILMNERVSQLDGTHHPRIENLINPLENETCKKYEKEINLKKYKFL